MVTPTPAQQAIIDHYEGHALVIAGPGSGKTTALIGHVEKLILERNVSPASIWVMAFNRDISSKLLERLTQDLGEKVPEVTTIHAFILRQSKSHAGDLLGNSEIADDLGECGMEYLLWKPISSRIKNVYGITKTTDGKRIDIRHIRGILFNQLRDYWLISMPPAKSSDDLFDKYKHEVERSKSIYGIVFLDELAIKLYEAMKANPAFKKSMTTSRIIIDEFQDLNPTEHGIIQQFSEVGTTFVVFGDDDQAINDFRRAHADYILGFKKVYAPKEFPLPRDRRCPKQILDMADDFLDGIRRLPKPLGNAAHKGRVDIFEFADDEAEKEGVTQIVNKYVSTVPQICENPQVLVLCGSLGTITGQSRTVDFIKSLKKAGVTEVTGEAKENPLDNEWGLVFRSTLQMILRGPSAMNLAAVVSVAYPKLMTTMETHIEAEERKGNPIDFLSAVFEVAKTEPATKQLLTEIGAMHGKIEKGDFSLDELIRLVPNTLNGKAETEQVIRRIWEEASGDPGTGTGEESNTENKSVTTLQQAIRAFSGEFKRTEVGRVHVTTYRKAKGLEADLVVVTSVDTRDFYVTDQMRRLLYVGATRAKKNLVLTFAAKRTKARAFARGNNPKSRGNPKAFRSYIIPSKYTTQVYSTEWLKKWDPIK